MPASLNHDRKRRVLGRLHLGAQLLFALFAVALIVAIVSGAIIRYTERNYLYSYMVEDRAEAFNLLSASLLDDLISEDLPRIETTVRQFIEKDPKLHSVQISNELGEALFFWHRPSPERENGGNKHENAEDNHLFYNTDIVLSGERFGQMAASWNMRSVEQDLAAHTYIMAIGVGGVCLLLGLLIYILTNLFAIRPINRISDRLAALQQGQIKDLKSPSSLAAVELQRLSEAVDHVHEFLRKKEKQEEALLQAKISAERSSKAKTEFLANMSHELRTPLNAINGFSEMITMEIFGKIYNAKYLEYAQKIHFSGKHLLSLINDILDLSKVESGKADLRCDEVEPRTLVTSMVDLVSSQVEKQGHMLDVNLDVGISTRLIVDQRRIQQVLLNLLSNAIKYTPPGGTIGLGCQEQSDGGFAFVISDNGVGIAPKQLEQAFEPFSRLESAYSRSHEGTGLGLPLARALVELHGGRLEITSAPGEGLTAQAILPPACVRRRISIPDIKRQRAVSE